MKKHDVEKYYKHQATVAHMRKLPHLLAYVDLATKHACICFER